MSEILSNTDSSDIEQDNIAEELEDDQEKTQILEQFDISEIPGEILNPLKEKTRRDPLTVSVARLLTFVNVILLVVGVIAIFFAVLRGQLKS